MGDGMQLWINMSWKTRPPWTTTTGATILEVLVVLSIIALISAIVAPRVVGYLGRARTDTALLQLQSTANAVQLFFVDTGRYPGDQEGLAALTETPTQNGDWNGPYIASANGLRDPWGRALIYEIGTEGTGFTIRSLGRDGVSGGSGEDADLEVRY